MGQVWYVDFLIGGLIFIIALAVYFSYVNNLSTGNDDTLMEISVDARRISESLLSSGYPDPWNATDVERLGLTNNNYRLDSAKLGNFSEMSAEEIRAASGTRFNVYVQLVGESGDIISINGLDGVGAPPVNSTDQIRVTRLVIYNSEIIKMVLDIWQ